MKISIFGLGYVGTVSAGCLAAEGHDVIGVDTNATKLDIINDGQSPIIEKDIGEIIKVAVERGKLRATHDVHDAISNSEVSFICVGTPSQVNGNLDLSYVRNVCEGIGAELKYKNNYHIVVVRSTMLPGSMRAVIIPILEEFSGKDAGPDFGVCINPEFLREGSAVYDFRNPPKTVIGELDSRCGDIMTALYSNIHAPLIRTSLEVAEMVKYSDNAWHALKITFANEIGVLCKSLGIDSHKVMDIFCQDTKLNLSPYYLKPGFAFGGSCLPKDLRALLYKARSRDLDLPMLSNILRSNDFQVKRAIDMIIAKKNKKVGILGFSFKAGTDDLRESPIVEMIERLLGKGYDIKLYDRNVNLASLVGANKNFILNRIPHISKLMVKTMNEVIEHAQTIVIGNADPEFHAISEQLKPGQVLVDLVRISDTRSEADKYDGICW